ncbi:hypothetical protein [Agrobacterium rubi]|uniref:Fimbrial protein n=1 Tax=Agrobacterium rubi TaxID=28099 RepID=A0AAE7R9F3_9HYPH|nr:hypothetical protein [Agrobacterium rubi]NTE87138.1 hypothetical protein [Agrobacterium rubi]NTF03072.1 hypothetical protein [Agrobacterium rubi]NTF37316.1 hypothetical protein [Agrobacterium rubi]OCJ55123.1 hypothetical protein A6U92_00430 [Agrobacterium rubi]QTF99733.1 hypothetical protein G6M88_04650 [Agrobacterium rubi]
MTQIEQAEQDDQPLDPAMEKVRRKMIRLQIVSGSVMFISLMAVFGAVVYKAVGPSKTATTATTNAVPSDAPVAATASLPPGFAIENVSFANGDMLFYGRLANGTRKALVFNVQAGRFVADITIDAR